jgi:GNAT superfamily N-acetyltransferase
VAGASGRDRSVRIRQAAPADVDEVADVLQEIVEWLGRQGDVMWEGGELERAAIAADVEAGQFYVAERAGIVAGVIRFQLEDDLFWPDLADSSSAFVHRLAVRRRFAGTGIADALLAWAVERARAHGRLWLRLDCDHQRTKLRGVYERFGFRLHSYRQVGPYYVARYEYSLVSPTGSKTDAAG